MVKSRYFQLLLALLLGGGSGSNSAVNLTAIPGFVGPNQIAVIP
jgi:hypothetical protein